MKKLFTRVVRTALLAMCALLALPAGAENFKGGETYYVQVYSSFFDSNAKLRVSYWGGGGDFDITEKVRDNLYKFTTPSNYNQEGITIKRTSSSYEEWDYANISKTDSNDLIKITGQAGNKILNYEWATRYPQSKTYYLQLWSGFFGDGAKIQVQFWDNSIVSLTDANKVDDNTYKFTIPNNYINDYLNIRRMNPNDMNGDPWTEWNIQNKGNNYNLINVTGWGTSEFGTYTEIVQQKVATPVISDADANNYVTITCATDGATIQYQIDNGSWTNYNSSTGISITANCTIKAKATKSGMTDSDTASKNVTFTKPAEVPVTLYICGNINGSGDWDKTTPVKMTKNGNVFTISNVSVNGATDNYVGFTTDNTKPNTADTRYGISTTGTTISDFSKTYDLQLKGNGFKLAAGKYDFTVDFTNANAPKMSISKVIDYSKWYFKIGKDSWKDNNGNGFWKYEVQPDANGYVVLNKVPLGNEQFKIQLYQYYDDNNKKDVDYQVSNYTLGKTVTPAIGSDWCTISGAEKDATYDFTFNCKTNQLKIVKTPEPTFPAMTYYIDLSDCEWYANDKAVIEIYNSANDKLLTTATYIDGIKLLSFNLTQTGIKEITIKRKVSGQIITNNNVTVNASTYKEGNNCIYINHNDGNGGFEKWSTYTPPAVEKKQYVFVGDINKWLNDGTYTNNEKLYPYGYTPAKYGNLDDWTFEKVDEAPSAQATNQNGWYKLVIPDCSAAGAKALAGQFTIYNGMWNHVEKKDASGKVTEEYYTPNWNGKNESGVGREQWSNSYGINSNEYVDVTEANINKAHIPANTIWTNCKKSSDNLQLSHNVYENATVWFCPNYSGENGAIYIKCQESDVKDFYVYYSNAQATAESTPKVKVNVASMNSKNYKLAFNGADSSDGAAMTYMAQGGTLDGVEYDHYWYYKILPGMEFPAGQLLTISLNEAPGVDYNDWTTIRNGNVKIFDGIHIFSQPDDTEIKVYEMYFRVYGFSEDGASIVAFDKDGNSIDGVEPDDTPTGDNGEKGWYKMFTGTIDSQYLDKTTHAIHKDYWDHTTNGGHFSTLAAHVENDADLFKESFEIPPMLANQYVQFYLKYAELIERPQSVKRRANEATTETPADALESWVPDSFNTDSSDPDATWTLNGNHKYYTPGIETGIEEIMDEEMIEELENSDVEPVFYNLQGQRVTNPGRGIYIRVRGSKVDKIML